MNDGVAWYTAGLASFPVYFPEDRVTCQWCAFCRYDDGLKRHYCLLTRELLPYPQRSRGNECPITITKEDKKNESDRK